MASWGHSTSAVSTFLTSLSISITFCGNLELSRPYKEFGRPTLTQFIFIHGPRVRDSATGGHSARRKTIFVAQVLTTVCSSIFSRHDWFGIPWYEESGTTGAIADQHQSIGIQGQDSRRTTGTADDRIG
jgi:hypothetical protein